MTASETRICEQILSDYLKHLVATLIDTIRLYCLLLSFADNQDSYLDIWLQKKSAT